MASSGSAIEDYKVVVSHWPDDGKAYFNMAAAEYKLGHFQEATNDYGQALRVNATWANALYGRGLAYVKLGNFDSAIADYTAALANGSSYSGEKGIAAVYFDRGIAYQKKFDVDQKDMELLSKARQDYQAAIEHGLKTADVYYDLGFACQKENKTDEAIANYGLALEQKPEYGEALRQRGEEYDAQGNWDAALKDLEKAKGLLPDDAAIYDALGRAHYGLREYQIAAEDYSKEIEIRAKGAYGPEIERRATAEAYVSLGTARYHAHDLPGAIEAYKKAAELRSDYALAYCDLNAVYLSSGEYDKAQQSRAAAMNASPADAKTSCKGEVLSESDVAARRDFKEGKYQQAAQGYRAAIAQNANDAEAHYGLGVSLYESDPKDLAGAISEFDMAISLRPQFAEAYNGRGLAYRAQGNLTAAEKDFRKAIEQRADFRAALLNLADVRAAQKEWADALTYYQKRTALQPDVALAWEGSGLARFKMNDFDGAAADYTKAIGLRADSVNAFLGRGDCYAKQGKWTEARADYDKALENYNASAAYGGKEKNGATLAGILLDRGVARFQLGDKYGARADYQKAVRLNPKNGTGYYDLGYVSLMENHLGAALADSNKAARLSDQKNADALDVEAIAQGDERHLKRSLADFNKALALKPGDVDLLFNRAAVEVALNQFGEAITDYDAVTVARPNDAEAYYRRGIAKGAKGDYQPALDRLWKSDFVEPELLESLCEPF